jgi:4'-phosphopantetheinyl transferase EntD
MLDDLAPIIAVLQTLVFGIALESRPLDPSAELNPAESLIAADMTQLRRAQFAAGRACARAALGRIGRTSLTIASDNDGVPLWPRGVVGSISHKYSQSIAVVGVMETFQGIGIDLERDEERDDRILAAEIASAHEAREMAKLKRHSIEVASTATWLLSAKEATYKAVFPLLRIPFSWEDIQISFVPDEGMFVPRIREASHLPMRGAIVGEGKWIAAICWIPR